MVKVSVVIPLYNSELYLRKCLDSLVNQTLKEFEIILIDDGSTDNSINIIKEFQNIYDNIILIEQKNSGIGRSRNKGIKKASGEYISFIDSDDYVENTFLEDMYNFCIKNNLDMCVCDYYIHNYDNTIIKKDVYDFGIKNILDDTTIIYKINHSPWNKLYKKDMIINNNIYFAQDLKYEDTPFVIKSIVCAERMGKLNKYLNHYIIRKKSETTVMDKRVFDIFKILDITNDYISDNIYINSKKYLNVEKILNYIIQQRYQKDNKLRNKFIDDAYKYLNDLFPDWKKCEYFNKNNFIRNLIEKNKLLAKIYCFIYNKIKLGS